MQQPDRWLGTGDGWARERWRSWSLVLACGAVLLASLLPGCGQSEGSRAPGPLRVVVTIAPLTGLVKELAPAGAEMRTLIPPGRSLHGYEMSPGDVAALAKADVVVYVGLGLDSSAEKFLVDHPSAGRQAVCFAEVAGIILTPEEREALEQEEDEEHGAGAEGGEHHEEDHHHGLVDPHLWVDPELVAKLVPAARSAIEAAERGAGTLSPEESVRLGAAEKSLFARIAEVDQEYRTRLAPLKGASCVTHHNAFGRLAARYGFEIAAVIRPIETLEPTPGQIAEAVAAIKQHGARAVFFEPQFDEAAARTIADSAGVRLGKLDPEGNTDWFALMRGNLDELVRLLSP